MVDAKSCSDNPLSIRKLFCDLGLDPPLTGKLAFAVGDDDF
jgi:hypothetical protein